MESTNTTGISTAEVTLSELGPRAFRLLAVVGAVGVGLGCVVGLAVVGDVSYMLHSYLVAYCFWLSISLGALFFVALQHATRAGWSVAVRRVAEILAGNMTLLVILFLPLLIPVLLGNSSLYVWNDSARLATDPVLEHKAPYLNAPFFGIRTVAYFLVWGMFARFFLARSTEQDHSGDPQLTILMERRSPVALILFSLTVTFAAFDWLMSLDPHWFSTIYGVYYFGGAFLGALCVMVLALIFLQGTGRLRSLVTAEHYHDLGKLMLAFVIFWGYIAFSQYMLIWYANIPEETTYYQSRQAGVWMWVLLALLFGHLLIPFLGLLPREVKRRRLTIGFWAVWLLVFHWLDLYWLIMPTYWSEGSHAADVGTAGVALRVVVDLTLVAGLGALYLAGVARVATDRALVPLRDPRLAESLALENV